MPRGRGRRRRHAGQRQRGADRIPVAYQDTWETVYRKWEALHGRQQRLPAPFEAVKQSSWVYSAVTFIAEHIMRSPLTIWRDNQRVENHPIQKLLEKPNSYDDQNTSQKFRYAYFMELLLNGAVMRLLGGAAGFTPASMAVRPRWQFRVEDAIDDMGRLVPTRWILTRTKGSWTFAPGDTIYHDALYNPLHDYEGLAPLSAALLSVSNDTDINEFAHRFFENDGSTGLVFSTDHPAFNQKQADDAAKKWKETYAGLSRAFGVKFVGFGLKPFNVGTPLDAKMLQVLRSFTKEEIVSGIYKVPLDAISAKDGGGDIVIGGPSGGTQASAREAFLVNVVMPWCIRYDEDFARDITWRFDASIEVKHDFTANPILERRRLERAQAAVELIDRGVPLNEVIRWLHLEITEQPHGDDWWIPSDRLPARIVLNAGDEALKIAIPPVPNPASPPADKKKKSQDQYVRSIVDVAERVAFRERVRGNGALHTLAHGKTNGQRIAEILGGELNEPPP